MTEERTIAVKASTLERARRLPEGGASTDDHGRRVLKKIDLMEVSIVSLPANLKARIQAVKSAFGSGGVPDRNDLFLALRSELGLSRKQAKLLLGGGYAALDPEAAELEDLKASIDRLAKAMAG